ncbi:MAG: hypothetical protein EOP06_18685, partial [Proteobacteria bacterium]
MPSHRDDKDIFEKVMGWLRDYFDKTKLSPLIIIFPVIILLLALFFSFRPQLLPRLFPEAPEEISREEDRQRLKGFQTGVFQPSDSLLLLGPDLDHSGIRDDIEAAAEKDYPSDPHAKSFVLAHGRLMREKMDLITQNKVDYQIARTAGTIRDQLILLAQKTLM